MTSAPLQASSTPPASPHELRRVLIAVTLLLVLVGGFVFAVARYRLVCFAVPCDVFQTVRGTIVTPEGTQIDGCTMTATEAPGANVLPGVSPSEPIEALEVPAAFEDAEAFVGNVVALAATLLFVAAIAQLEPVPGRSRGLFTALLAVTTASLDWAFALAVMISAWAADNTAG